MISIQSIAKNLSQQVQIEYLRKIAYRHKHLDQVPKIIREMMMDIRVKMDEEAEAMGAEWTLLRRMTMKSMLAKHKTHMRPDDWLYLKAILTDDKEVARVLLHQAQAIAPENGHLYAALIDFEKDGHEAFYALVPDFHIQQEDIALQNHFCFLKLLLQLELPFSEQSPGAFSRLLNDIRLNSFQLYGLLAHMTTYANSGLMTEVMAELETNDSLVKRIYALVKGMLHYDQKQYQLAIERFLTANIETLPFEEYEKTRQLNRMAWAYLHSGKQKAAAAIWKYIAGDPERSESGIMACSDAFLQLARYYMNKGRLKEARDVLCSISEKAMDTLLFYGMGFEYYSLLGEICRTDKNYTDALGYYCRAYKFGHREELLVIIRELEKLCV